MGPYVQVCGSLLILIPFVLAQLGRLTPLSTPYLLLNLGGAVVLAVDAALGSQWGFLLLEGVWALVSVTSFLRRKRAPRPRDVAAPA